MLFPAPAAFRKIETDPVFAENGFLHIPARVFEDLAFEAFRDVSHLLRADHLRALRGVFDDPRSSGNERFAALQFLKNANIAAGMVLPLCQDTGTAIVLGEKGHLVLTDGEESAAIERGIKKAYTALNLRYSQNAPTSFFTEKNTGDNLPAQIDLTAAKGNEYRFLMIAKGGKMVLLQTINKGVITMDKSNFNTIEDVRKAGRHLSLEERGPQMRGTLKSIFQIHMYKYVIKLLWQKRHMEIGIGFFTECFVK